jgi:cryptochrome
MIALHWFRKGLRLHDNPGLVAAARGMEAKSIHEPVVLHRPPQIGQHLLPKSYLFDPVEALMPAAKPNFDLENLDSARVYPVYILDPKFADPEKVGVRRYTFLLESLRDLDDQLRKLGSRLYVLKGSPQVVMPKLCKEWNVKRVTWEADTEPYAIERDQSVYESLEKLGIRVHVFSSHTLHHPSQYILAAKGEPTDYGKKRKKKDSSSSSVCFDAASLAPKTYSSFLKLYEFAGNPLRSFDVEFSSKDFVQGNDESKYDVPTLSEMGYDGIGLKPSELHWHYPGGESEALARLERIFTDIDFVCNFEKPKTSPNSITASTTVLSPYLKFGCLSSRRFYWKIYETYGQRKHTKPPVSLRGQLYWREFYYLNGYVLGNKYDKMVGNPICRQIPWRHDEDFLDAWENSRTGFPFIDAIMTQLRDEGWIHHLARHAVACFLTRGDLWQNWEHGVRIFEKYLLDADWSINVGNWLWLSCSSFFYQYFRCYSPIAFGKKTDPGGLYIRRYLPILAKFPDKFIYEPWNAPRTVQEACGCIIGRDYPEPIVDHSVVSKENMSRMKQAYIDQKTPLPEPKPQFQNNRKKRKHK